MAGLVNPNKCNTNNSEVLNKQAVILVFDAKYTPDYKFIQPDMFTGFLPDNFGSLKDTANAVTDSLQGANSKSTSTRIVSYDPEISFKTNFMARGAFGEFLNKKIKDRKIGLAANIVIWQIYDVGGRQWDETLEREVGTEFEVRQWVGGLKTDIDFNNGDDTKYIDRTITIKPDHCDGDTFTIKDPKIAPLIVAYLDTKHWGKAGLWDNDVEGRLVSSK